MSFKRLACVAAIMVVLCLSEALADLWFFPAERTTKEYEFGEVKIELVTDAREDRQWPLFELMIYKGDELQAKYRNVAFEEIFASDDNRFFLGVSNTGVPGTAFVIFDSDGKLLREVKHEFLEIDIQDQSPTLCKKWYDSGNPGVKFVVNNGGLAELHINTTNVTYRDLVNVSSMDLMDGMWRRDIDLKLSNRGFLDIVPQAKTGRKPPREKGMSDGPFPRFDRND